MSTTTPSSPSPERRRPARRLLPVVVALGVASFVVVGWATRPGPSELTAVQDVPADVRSELDVTWSAFAELFSGRMTCIDDVEVLLVSEVDGGDARYLPALGRIEIEIPTTPARFRESLAHELAHHVETTCGAFEMLRTDLHPLLGDADQPWSRGPIWFDVPAERYAEHVAELVVGERVRHRDEVPIQPEVSRLIAAWGSG